MLISTVAFLFSHFFAVVFFGAWIFAFIRIVFHRPLERDYILDVLTCYLFIAVGLGAMWAGCFHVFAPDLAASYIGWQNSPFQFEVGVGDIGMGAAAIMAGFASRDFRWAVLVYFTIFSWGAALGHIYQMWIERNFAPGNAGLVFWLDIVQPLTLLILMMLSHKQKGAENEQR
ncbi:MAG: DUF6790 family protein [Polynucleobacter sp.]|nr:DUF6790 family protein [Polynucleobacter sp.]